MKLHRWKSIILMGMVLGFAFTSVSAETYRWKDKDGNVHFGASVPAEYADQPYDILNNAGEFVERIVDTSVPVDVIEQEKEKKGRQPLISEEQRQIHRDKLLVIQYTSEKDITDSLDLEMAQLGYDSRFVTESLERGAKALRDEIRVAADQQRSNQPVNEAQKTEIAELYARRLADTKRQQRLEIREQRVRARFQKDLDRYRYLTSKDKPVESVETDQG